MSIYISSIDDLESWVRKQFGDRLSGDDVLRFADLLEGDEGRPVWGHDWQPYLDSQPDPVELLEGM